MNYCLRLQTILLLTFYLIGNTTVVAQPRVRGFVIDTQTKKGVPGVFVNMANTTTVSDSTGSFLFNLKKKGAYKVILQHISYYPNNISVRVTGDTTITLGLSPMLHSLKEVTVSRSTSERKSANLSIAAIDMQKSVPLLGEHNIGLMLQQKPGVAHAQEINPGLYVRGFSNSQNKVLLNGSPIFNPNHLLGIFSSVDGKVIAKTELLSDDVHPRYGDFLSSCLIMEGNNQLADSNEFEAGIGLLTSHIYSRAPIVKNKISYVVAARRSYFDIISNTYNRRINTDASDNKLPDYRLYDVNASVIVKPTSSDKVIVSAFHSGDKLSLQQNHLNVNSDWGNTATNILWDKAVSKHLTIRSNGGFSRYSTNTSVIKSDVSLIANSINRYYLSVEGMVKASESSQVDIGIFGSGTSTKINNDSKEINGDESVLKSKAGKYGSLGAYAAASQQIGKHLQVKCGLRMESFAGSHVYFSPRVFVQSPITSFVTLFASYSQRQQFDHLYAPMGINLPIDMIIPSDDTIKPQQSKQFGLGANIRIANQIQVLLSCYYSTLSNQLDFVNPEPLNQGFYYTLGRGRAKGIEVMASYRTKEMSLEASYSLSESLRQFDKINDGSWFNPPFDIRHKIDFTGYVRLSPKLSLSVSQFVQSGNIVTVPTSIYYNQATNKVVPVYTSRYNLRLPLTHRLDVSMLYTVVKSFGEIRYSVGVYNLYNHANPYFIYFKIAKQDNEQTHFVTKKKSLLPMVPFFMIEVNL